MRAWPLAFCQDVEDRIGHGVAVFGAEDDVEEDFGIGAGHGCPLEVSGISFAPPGREEGR
jgi:hypothetical protein